MRFISPLRCFNIFVILSLLGQSLLPALAMAADMQLAVFEPVINFNHSGTQDGNGNPTTFAHN